MKKVNDYRKLLNVTKTTTLQELKNAYRNAMKTNHPDRVQDEEKKAELEELSKELIEAYHFLVSIAPETIDLKSRNISRPPQHPTSQILIISIIY